MIAIRTTNVDGNMVRVGDGVAVPRRWEAVVNDEPGVPGRVRMVVEYDARLQRAVATSVTVDRSGLGDEVTSLTLREVRVQAVIQSSGLQVTRIASGSKEVSAAAFLKRLRTNSAVPPSEVLRTAAIAYRLSAVVSLPPLKTVADTLGISQSTATRLMNRARAAGFLADRSATGPHTNNPQTGPTGPRVGQEIQ